MARALLGVLLLVSLNRAGVERAVNLARWPHSDAERARFHTRYVTKYQIPQGLAGPAVESIEVVTEFRRMELIAEAHEQAHDMFARGGAIQEAEDALKPFRGQVTIVAHVQFGVLTIGSPDIVVALAGPGAPPPIASKLTPLYSGDTLVGGAFESAFTATSIGQSIYAVVVRWNATELARATVDFGAID